MGVSSDVVREWYLRDCIPERRFETLIEISKRRFPGITYARLSALYNARKKPRT